jgi:hypothetical protein
MIYSNPEDGYVYMVNDNHEIIREFTSVQAVVDELQYEYPEIKRASIDQATRMFCKSYGFYWFLKYKWDLGMRPQPVRLPAP